MKKYRKIAFLAMGILVACGEARNNKAKQRTKRLEEVMFPVIFTDTTDAAIMLEVPSKRMVAVMPSNIEICLELALNHVIKISQWLGFDTMTAVNNKRSVQIADHLLSCQQPRFANELEILVQAIYSEAYV